MFALIAGVGKNRDFRPISCFISEMIQDSAIVTMELDPQLMSYHRLANRY